MMGKRISAILFLAVVAAVPLSMWQYGWLRSLPEIDAEMIASGELAMRAERSFKDNFPLREKFCDLAWNLRYRTGTKELEGYFITNEGSVIKNVGGISRDELRERSKIVLQFAERADMPSAYFMPLPTACAIKQQELPAFVTLYNQKNMIDDLSKLFAGRITTVNVYPTLLANQEKYLYYRTEELLTPLGGYLVYSQLAPKLKWPVHPPDQFQVEYPIHSYRGSLARKFPYAQIKPDILSLYHYYNNDLSDKANQRSYQVTHRNGGGQVTYDALYRKSALTSANPLDVYLGGLSQTIELEIKGGRDASDARLLVIGDENLRSIVPFLAPHCSYLVVVDIATVTEEQLKAIDGELFDKVLFAFSADTFLHEENLFVLEQ